MKRTVHMARRRMSHVIDELYTALFRMCGKEVDMQLRREEDGLRLTIRGDFPVENRRQVERMAEMLQPAVRNCALVETYWELAGGDQYTSDSELSLVGQMLDEARVDIGDGEVRMNLYLAF